MEETEKASESMNRIFCVEAQDCVTENTEILEEHNSRRLRVYQLEDLDVVVGCENGWTADLLEEGQIDQAGLCYFWRERVTLRMRVVAGRC